MPRPAAKPVEEPAGFPRWDKVWDVKWLRGLRKRMPKNASWPRLMSAPHPRAVGSLGVEFTKWARRELGLELRWWQQLFVTRLLEVDAEDRLVWDSALLSVARQCGKSTQLWALCDWRCEQSVRFGEDQLILLTADSLDSSKIVQGLAKDRARALGFKVREGAGDLEISRPHARWLVRSQSGVVGHSASFAVADEAHKVTLRAVVEKLEPTTVEKTQSQVLLSSTAASECTTLMPTRRAAAMARLADPADELMVEWSAPRDSLIVDESAWRAASPHWSPERERKIRALAEAAAPYEQDQPDHELVVAMHTQWFNWWPQIGVAGVRGEELVDGDRWRAAVCDLDAEGPLVIGVEAHHNRGAAVAFCATLVDGRFLLGGELCASRAAAYTAATEVATLRPSSTLVVGASLAKDAEVLAIPVDIVKRAGMNETPAGLSSLREFLGDRVLHDGSVDLEAQMLAARVTVGVGGLRLVSGQRSDLVRAAVWALQLALTEPAVAPAIHWAS